MTAESKILTTYKKAIENDYSTMIHSNKGIDAKVFFDITELSGINRKVLAEQIFDLSTKTF